MVANVNPIFTLVPNIGSVLIDTANANLDGTGTVGVTFTAGADGSRVHRITIKARETTTTGMIRFFLNSGAAYYLYREIPVTVAVPSATVAAFSYLIELFGERALILPDGWTLEVSTEKAEHFYVIAEGGDY